MNAIFEMGGYELFVWGSFGCALAVFVWNVMAPRMSRRSTMNRLRQAMDEEER